MCRAFGLWYSYPKEFRALMVNGMRYDYSWNHPGQHYSNIYEHIRHMEVVRESSGSDCALMNVSEYLGQIFALGVREEDLPVIPPIFQKRIWDRFKSGEGPDKLSVVIDQLRREDGRFHVEGGSWTNKISWVRGYETLLGPMERASSLFHEKVLKPGLPTYEYRYRNALFHLMVSQTAFPLFSMTAVI
jgi:hypothetical protein